MKKIVVFIALLFLVLVTPMVRVQAADTAQNVLVSCLDAHVVPDPADPDMQQYAGILLTREQENWFVNHGLLHKFHLWREPSSGNVYAHVAMLKNKTDGAKVYKFEPTKPVSIIRTHQGNYECATDKNKVSTCPAGPVPTVADLGYGMEFRVMDQTKEQIMPAADGTLTVNHVMSWTEQLLDQSFFGMQILTQMTSGDQTAAIGTALKLATFTPEMEVPDAATNCVTVSWDPFGRVIDAKTLEPVQNVSITLYNQDGANKVQTVNPRNPLFTNPYKTVADGTYNFAVLAGTYYMTPQHTDFTFPADPALLQAAISGLKQFDPNGAYVDTTKLLTSVDEKIVEQEGVPEKRDIILVPKNPNYSGTDAVIQTKNSMHDGKNIVLTGMVSHPKTVVRALINGVVKAQVQTDLTRSYSLAIPETSLPVGFDGDIGLEIQKIPLTGGEVTPSATTSTTVTLMPTFVSGFAVDKEGKVIPNAVVETVIPKLDNLSYSLTAADADGFFVLDGKKLPTVEFSLRFTNPLNPEKSFVLSTKEFGMQNKAYFAETKRNMFTSVDTAVLSSTFKPAKDLVTALKQSFVRTAPSNVSPTTAPTQASAQTEGVNSMLPMLLLLLVVVVAGFGIALFLIKKPGTRM